MMFMIIEFKMNDFSLKKVFEMVIMGRITVLFSSLLMEETLLFMVIPIMMILYLISMV
jgi:hypothetical protein